MLFKYGKNHGYLDDILTKFPKMAFGVGKAEVAYIRTRQKAFSELYPYMRLIEEDELAKLEPNLVNVNGKPRSEPVIAMGTDTEYSWGSSSQLWGLSLSPADIIASNFGFVWQGEYQVPMSTTIFVDALSLTVYYSIPEPNVTVAFSPGVLVA